MLNLGFAIVEKTSLVGREAERVEANVTGHGTVEDGRTLGEGQGLGLDHGRPLLGGGVEGRAG